MYVRFRYSGKKLLRFAVFWRISVRFCGFGPPLRPPPFVRARSLFILYVRERDRPGFGMLTVETAVIPGLYLIAFVDFNSPNCDRKGQSYPVEYYLESVEEYS